MHPVRFPFPPVCALALALAGLTASCSFNPSPLTDNGEPDGAVDIIPDAEVQQPDANPGMPDANVTPPDSRVIDAEVPPDAPPPCAGWPAPRHFDPCGIPVPRGPLVLDQAGEYVYDTDAATLRAPDSTPISHATSILPGDPALRLISVEHLLISANARLRVVGGRPFVVASWSEMIVDGEIDVSSSEASRGAGADTGDCNAAGTGGQDNDGGGGGGGGG